MGRLPGCTRHRRGRITDHFHQVFRILIGADTQIRQLLVAQAGHKRIQRLRPACHFFPSHRRACRNLRRHFLIDSLLHRQVCRLDPYRLRIFLLFRLSFIGNGIALRLQILKTTVAADILHLLHRFGLIQRHRSRDMGITGTVTHTDIVCTRLHHIGRALCTIGCHGLRIKSYRHILALPGRQFLRLRIACQLLIRFVQLSCRRGVVNLHHFLTRCSAGIGHRRRNGYLCRIRRQLLRLHGKCGVSHTITERIGGHIADGIKIAVSYIDAFFIICIVRIAETFRGRIVLDRRPGHSQLAGRIRLTQKHIRQRVSRGGTKLPQKQDRAHCRHRL